MHNHDVSVVLGVYMAYEWQLIRSNLGPTPGDESWQIITLSAPVTPIIYGFRLTLATTPRPQWNTSGYFTIYQVAGGKGSMSRTQLMPLFGSGDSQALRILGPGDIDVVPVGGEVFALIYQVHSWIDADSMEIWGYYEI